MIEASIIEDERLKAEMIVCPAGAYSKEIFLNYIRLFAKNQSWDRK